LPPLVALFRAPNAAVERSADSTQINEAQKASLRFIKIHQLYVNHW